MIRTFWMSLLISASSASAFAQDAIKVEALKSAPPSALSSEIAQLLDGEKSYLVKDAQGEDFARIWLRKSTPGSEKPSGPKGAIQFPFLKDGELLGALEFVKAGADYRDQEIEKGVYTMRYGLQPVNGDHLGVSTFRDYVLLLPASKDSKPEAPTREQLEERSADSAGTSHPAAFLLLMAPDPSKAKPEPSVHYDQINDTWGVILPVHLQVKGGDAVVYPFQLVVVGFSAA